MNDTVEKMRLMLIGRSSELTTMFDRVVDSFEERIAAEKKRADDAEESLRRVKADFPQQEPRKFKTEIGRDG